MGILVEPEYYLLLVFFCPPVTLFPLKLLNFVPLFLNLPTVKTSLPIPVPDTRHISTPGNKNTISRITSQFSTNLGDQRAMAGNGANFDCGPTFRFKYSLLNCYGTHSE